MNTMLNGATPILKLNRRSSSCLAALVSNIEMVGQLASYSPEDKALCVEDPQHSAHYLASCVEVLIDDLSRIQYAYACLLTDWLMLDGDQKATGCLSRDDAQSALLALSQLAGAAVPELLMLHDNLSYQATKGARDE